MDSQTAPRDESEQAAATRTSNAHIVDFILSEGFNQLLNHIPNGDMRRVRALFEAGRQFAVHYETSKSISSLDRAIEFTAEALEEIPKPHPELDNYATIYTHLLQLKAEKTGKLEDGDRYISGLKKKIQFVREETWKKHAVRELGCAYFSRFGQSNDFKDLGQAIDILEECFETPGKIDLQATIYLGAAFYHRFSESKQIEDLDSAASLLRRGLQRLLKDEGRIARLRDFGLEKLVSACATLNNKQPGGETLERMISNIEMTLASFPPGTTGISRLNKQHIYALMRRYFKGPESVQEIRDMIERAKHEKETGSQNAIVDTEWVDKFTSSFTHQPLSDSRRNIRLIELFSGPKSHPIKCKLIEEKLDGGRSYEALSYVWGDPKDTTPICVNAGIYRVTKNLYSALLRLRHTTAARTLWADAICIDQTNLKEKQHQITLMRNIYKKATTVIMWLGEPKDIEFFTVGPPPKVTIEKDKKSLELRSLNSSLVGMKTNPDTGPASTAGEPTISRDSLENQHILVLSTDVAAAGMKLLVEEKLQWLQPVLYGCKPATMMTSQGIAGFRDIVRDATEKAFMQSRTEIMFQDLRTRLLPGAQLDTFDWTSIENIPAFFSAPQTRDMWPTLGAFSLIYALAHMNHFHELPFFGRRDIFPSLAGGDDLAYHPSQIWIKSATALDSLLSSSYWNRAWILQEIVLAQRPILYYGPHIIPFDHLVQAQKNFEVHYKQCCAEWGNNAYRKEHTYWTAILDGFHKLGTLESLRKACISSDASGGGDPSLSLFNIMRTGVGNREASDRRDLVYGILGLIDSKDKIEPDYTLNVAQVFARAAIHIICEQESLLLLTFNDLGCHQGLPSWVPDWGQNGKFRPQPYEYQLFMASKDLPYHARLNDDLQLEIRSIRVDQVTETSSMRILSFSHPRDLVSQIKAWRRRAGLQDQPATQDAVEDREETFWRAVFADTMEEYEDENSKNEKRRFQKRDLGKVLGWWEWLQTEAETFLGTEWDSFRTLLCKEGFHAITNMFWHSTEIRKLIFTSAGRMGTGLAAFGQPEFVEVAAGDEIHVAFGSNLPIILRPLQQGEKIASRKTYRFIGSCYLHGIMDGEALADESLGRDDILLC